MGRIIFGAIDTTKYHGELVSLPVQLSQGAFTDWVVALTLVARSDGHGTKVLTAKNLSVPAILDSGSPNIYLPSALVDEISASMNVTMYEGFPYVPCAIRKVPDYIKFGFGGPGGPNISVPYSALIYPFGNPANLGNVTSKVGTPLCYLGIIGTDGGIYLLGDTFMRSAYLVYDVDNTQIAIAPVKYDISQGHILSIPAGTRLPGVTSTNSYLLPTASPGTA